MSNNGNGKGIGVSSPPNYLHNYRCRACGRLLFRAILPAGAEVEIRCTRNSCHSMNVFMLPVLQLENIACNPVDVVLE